MEWAAASGRGNSSGAELSAPLWTVQLVARPHCLRYLVSLYHGLRLRHGARGRRGATDVAGAGYPAEYSRARLLARIRAGFGSSLSAPQPGPGTGFGVD